MTTKNGLRTGDKVRYIENDDGVYTVFAVYDKTHVSLGLRDYPDSEQDFQTEISEIVKV